MGVKERKQIKRRVRGTNREMVKRKKRKRERDGNAVETEEKGRVRKTE